MTLASALDRVLDPLLSTLTPELAEKVVAHRADDQLQARLDELAEKSNEGSLTPGETAEYDAYLRALTMVSVFQTRARAILHSRAAG
jgi:hypothetical protein